MSDSPEKTRGAAAGLALLAAGAPAVFLGAFLAGAMAVSGPQDMARFLQEGGTPGYLVLFVSAGAAVGCAFAVYFCARGSGLPAAVPALVAGLPWVAGGAGTLYSVRTMEQALAAANPSGKAIIAAAGVSEALSVRLLGAWCGSALLAGVAVGLGVATVGRASMTGRGVSAVGSLLGAALALPVLGLAVMSIAGLGVLAAPAVAAALAAALALGLAGAGLRPQEGDAPRVRLAIAAAACAGLAFVAAALAAAPAIERQVLAALAMVNPAERLGLLALGLEGSTAARSLATLGPLLGLLPLAALALWGASRSAEVRAYARAAAFVLVALAVLGVDRLAAARPAESLRRLASTPWSDLPDFQPSRFQASGEHDEVRLLVTPTQVLAPASGSYQPRPAVTLGPSTDELLRELRILSKRIYPGRPGTAKRSPLDQSRRREREPEEEPLASRMAPRLVMAVDARVPGAALMQVLEAAQQAEFRSVAFAAEDPEAAVLRGGGTALPLLASLWLRRVTPLVALAGVVPEQTAARDPTLWHGTISADDPVRFETRPGSTAGARELFFGSDGKASIPPPREGYLGDHEYPVYSQLDPGVTPERVAKVVSALFEHGYLPVLTLGAVPGKPAEPLAPVVPLPEATADPVVLGSLHTGLIKLVFRQHSRELSYCYETQLSENPTLDGTVTVKFVISSAGEVTSARVQSSTAFNEALESCVIERVKSWQFPAPDGGGMVVVSYPFSFPFDDGVLPKLAPGDPEPTPPPERTDRPAVAVASLEAPLVLGSMDRRLIQKVVSRNLGGVKHCYETQLQRHPRLEGTVRVKFIIAASGHVAAATIPSSTVANETLESCVVARVRSWRFPKPNGGGVVIVVYPFVFKPGAPAP